MKITCTGRKVALKDAFEARVDKRLGKLKKFFSDEAEAQVTVTVEKDWQTVEITVRDKGFTCRAEKMSQQMEEAFELACDLLERRIIKNRKRLDARLQAPPPDYFAAQETEEPEEEYAVIREKRFFVKPSTVEDAILEMNMLGHSFFIFRDAETDEFNVVYTRKNGSYGLLVPER